MNAQKLGLRRTRTLITRTAAKVQERIETVACEPEELEDILITGKLRSRRRRKPNTYSENVALQALASIMASEPGKLIDTLLRMALELCDAGSAGLSLLETLPNGEQIFRWTNLAGVLDQHVGLSTPRHFSFCGVALDRNAPQLFAHPERRFQYLGKVNVPLVEALVIPVHLGEDRLGSIWIVSHNEEVKFDSEDVRLMTGLAEFTSCALRLTQAYDLERKERAEGSRQIAVHEETEEALRLERTKLEGMVQSRTAQLQQLSSRLMAMQDDERRRIARELHDSAGQYLAGIHMNLQALLRESSSLSRTDRERVTDSLTMSEQCTSEIRTISYLLHPPLLDEVGLASAIYWYVDGFSQRSGIRVELQIEEGIRELPDELKNALFRVVQQSLANIHRHSGSEVAQIRINIDAESLTAEICDEGRGIPEETLKGFHDGTRLPGVGIAGMRERIRDMGGLFEVRSGVKGTTIAVRMPLPADLQVMNAGQSAQA
jgi:signal transduction histidine kinase